MSPKDAFDNQVDSNQPLIIKRFNNATIREGMTRTLVNFNYDGQGAFVEDPNGNNVEFNVTFIPLKKEEFDKVIFPTPSKIEAVAFDGDDRDELSREQLIVLASMKRYLENQGIDDGGLNSETKIKIGGKLLDDKKVSRELSII